MFAGVIIEEIKVFPYLSYAHVSSRDRSSNIPSEFCRAASYRACYRIGRRTTVCYETSYRNFALGKDGYSAAPFVANVGVSLAQNQEKENKYSVF